MLDKIVSFITGFVKSYFTRDALLKFIKDKLFGVVITKILGAAAGGWQLFLLKTGLGYLWKNYIGPGVRFVFRKIEMFFRKKDNQGKVTKLDETKSEKEFDDAFDDMP